MHKIGIIMGSKSDQPIMKQAAEVCKLFNLSYEFHVVSAHRTPEKMVEYAQSARDRGVSIIIAGAGGAAHLPGMVASLTPLPVIGVPIKSTHSIMGLDSLLSIVQMPGGIPVATVAVDGAKNAGLLAVKIIALQNPSVMQQIIAYQNELIEKVDQMDDEVGHDFIAE